VAGNKFGDSFRKGLDAAWKQGIVGGAIGGISAGISGAANGRNFWTGDAKGSMYVSAERLSINVPEQRAQLSADGMNTEINPFYSNSEMYFDGESLLLLDNYSNNTQSLRNSWNAVSGPYGNGQLPHGEWRAYSITRLDPLNQPNFSSYSRDGFDFWMGLDPQFTTTRNGIGVHPDGEALGSWWLNNGSSGCIVLQEGSTSLEGFYNSMRKYLSRNPYISLYY